MGFLLSKIRDIWRAPRGVAQSLLVASSPVIVALLKLLFDLLQK